MLILANIGYALLAISVSWVILNTILGYERLQVFSHPVARIPKDRPKSNFWIVWGVYWLSAVLTVAFGAILWTGIRLEAGISFYAPAFLTMTVIGAFRLLCVMVPAISPNTIAVWLMATMAAGLYGLLSEVLPSGPVLLSINAGTSLASLPGNPMAVVTLASIPLAVGVEIVLALLVEAQRRGWTTTL